MGDLLTGMDIRARRALTKREQGQRILTGQIMRVGHSSADVKLDGSEKYTRNVEVLEGMDFEIGDRVLLARTARQSLIIIGAAIARTTARTPASSEYATSFAGLQDNAGNNVDPDPGDLRIQVTDDGVINADLDSSYILALSITQGQIDHGSVGGLAGDDHPQYPETDQSEAITGAWTFQANLTTRHLLPEAVDTYDLGSSSLLYRKLWASEIEAILFVENSVSLIGGWFMIPHDSGTLGANLGSGDDTCNFGKTMTVGDFVLIRGNLQVEYFEVGTLVSGTTYRIGNIGSGARNLDGSGPNAWPQGQAFAVLGVSGDGRIELDAQSANPRVSLYRQGATYNAQDELIRIGDLNGGWGYSSEKWGMAIGKYAASLGNLVLDQDGAIKLRTHSTTHILLEADGDVFIGEDISAAATTNLAIFTNAQTYNSESVSAGDVLLGDNTTGKANIFWDKSAGKFQFRGGQTMACEIGMDGSLLAGVGMVVLDSDGIEIKATTSYQDIRSYKFATDGGTILGGVRCYHNVGTLHYLELKANSIAGEGSTVDITASAPSTGERGAVRLYAYGGVGDNCYLDIEVDASSNSIITANCDYMLIDNSGDLRVEGGLYVGDDVAPDTDDIHFDGNLKSMKNSTFYDVYGLVRLDASLKAVGVWDGQPRSTTAKTIIDLQSVFSAPANIKAILCRVTIRDSGSAANSCVFWLSPNNTANRGMDTRCSGLANDAWTSNCVTVPCTSGGDIYYQVVASGASTMDVYLEILGYWI